MARSGWSIPDLRKVERGAKSTLYLEAEAGAAHRNEVGAIPFRWPSCATTSLREREAGGAVVRVELKIAKASI